MKCQMELLEKMMEHMEHLLLQNVCKDDVGHVNAMDSNSNGENVQGANGESRKGR